MPVKRYFVSDHYHIITYEIDDMYISVGLTSDKPKNAKNQKLLIVYESNGKKARLKSCATIDKKIKYSKDNAKFNVDIEAEKKALELSQAKRKHYKK